MSNNDITVKGVIKDIGQTEHFGSGDFCKRVLVVTVADGKDGKYNQHVPIEFIKDAGAKLDGLAIGQEVSVGAKLRGREGSGRYWLSLAGWRIDSQGAAPQAQAAPVAEHTEGSLDDETGESLPF